MCPPFIVQLPNTVKTLISTHTRTHLSTTQFLRNRALTLSTSAVTLYTLPSLSASTLIFYRTSQETMPEEGKVITSGRHKCVLRSPLAQQIGDTQAEIRFAEPAPDYAVVKESLIKFNPRGTKNPVPLH